MAEDQSLEDLRNSIKQQLEEARKRVAALEKAYNALSPSEMESEYRGLRAWVAVRQYLKRVGKASVNDIVDELTHGGADLGRYPLRTISITIGSPHMKKIFKVEQVGNDNVVSLHEKGGAIAAPSKRKA